MLWVILAGVAGLILIAFIWPSPTRRPDGPEPDSSAGRASDEPAPPPDAAGGPFPAKDAARLLRDGYEDDLRPLGLKAPDD